MQFGINALAFGNSPWASKGIFGNKRRGSSAICDLNCCNIICLVSCENCSHLCWSIILLHMPDGCKKTCNIGRMHASHI